MQAIYSCHRCMVIGFSVTLYTDIAMAMVKVLSCYMHTCYKYMQRKDIYAGLIDSFEEYRSVLYVCTSLVCIYTRKSTSMIIIIYLPNYTPFSIGL